MIKLIACDMDGTLLNENGELGDQFPGIFDKLIARGIKFAAASGRQYHQLVRNFDGMGDEIIYIAENGTLVKYQDREIMSCPMDPEDVVQVVEKSKELANTHLVLCCKECAYIDTDEEKVLQEIRKYYYCYKIVSDLEKVKDQVLKIAFLDFEGSEKNSFTVMNPLFGHRLKVSVSGEIWLDIYSMEANKGLAIRHLQKTFGIKRNETMVFGDYFNDVDMMREADYSYAMDNAPEGVKAHARFIAKSNREDGVSQAIKEVVLENE